MYSFHSITQQKQSREINKKTYETFDIQLKKCVEYGTSETKKHIKTTILMCSDMVCAHDLKFKKYTTNTPTSL